MNLRLVIISLALGLFVLALGGWLVQALLWPPRTLGASARAAGRVVSTARP